MRTEKTPYSKLKRRSKVKNSLSLRPTRRELTDQPEKNLQNTMEDKCSMNKVTVSLVQGPSTASCVIALLYHNFPTDLITPLQWV
jgi:hypothetical protein